MAPPGLAEEWEDVVMELDWAAAELDTAVLEDRGRVVDELRDSGSLPYDTG